MFSTYTPSKYDTTIILICLFIFIFISVMISSQIEKNKNKFEDGIIAILVLAGIFGFSILTSTMKSFEYVFYIFIVLGCIFILLRNIISFYNKNKYSKGVSKGVKIKYGGTIGSIFSIILILKPTFNAGKFDLIGIFVIIVLLINLPMDYSVNHYITLTECGILLGICTFPNKFIPYDEIISYEDIENLTFIEYAKGKFNLAIQVKKSIRKTPFKYKMRDEEKEEIISFIGDFVQKEKIIILAEYD